MTAEGYGGDTASIEKAGLREMSHDERLFNLEATVTIMQRQNERLRRRVEKITRHVGGAPIDPEPEPEEPFPLLGPGAHQDKISPLRRGT